MLKSLRNISLRLLYKTRYYLIFKGYIIVFVFVAFGSYIYAISLDHMHDIIANDNDQEPYSIFILAGQSNAEGSSSSKSTLEDGVGLYKKDHPADVATGFWAAGKDGNGPEDSAYNLINFFNGNNPAGWWDTGDGTADKLKNINYPQTDFHFGPEFGIARHLYDRGRRKVIILKVAYGFQSLAQSSSVFIPFDWNTNSSNKSYDRLKSEYNLLTTYLRNRGDKYTFDGFFWMQGETDTLQSEYASSYQTNLQSLVNAIRNDLALHPSAHIVIGRISLQNCLNKGWPVDDVYCGYPYVKNVEPLELGDYNFYPAINASRQKQVRDAEQIVADSDQNDKIKIDLVETEDLTRGSDYIHMIAREHIELGRRFISMYDLPLRYDSNPGLLHSANDYDGDGIYNSLEDTGTGQDCNVDGSAMNGNLGDDDTDCDGYPNYLDAINGKGSGINE